MKGPKKTVISRFLGALLLEHLAYLWWPANSPEATELRVSLDWVHHQFSLPERAGCLGYPDISRKAEAQGDVSCG